MRQRVAFVVVALVLCGAPVFAGEQFTGQVVGITDGDTISVMREGRAVRVRLEGIDCPEKGQEFSQRAKQFTSDMVFGKAVTVAVRDIDRYGRLVARVSFNGEDVSLALVRSGLAWHFTRYSSDPQLATAETVAKFGKVGLWSHTNPIAPWEFRRSKGRSPQIGGSWRSNRSLLQFSSGHSDVYRHAFFASAIRA
jgi:micrococcal nuclease